MPDPVATSLTSGSSSLATTVVNFSAQPAGSLLLLACAADDYKNGNPSGWTAGPAITATSFHGLAVWYKVATGSETSVSYVINSASRSAYALISISEIDQTTPVDTAPAAQFQNTSSQSYTTPTATTTAGRRIAIGVIGMSLSSTLITGVEAWTNSYTEIIDGESTTTPGLVVGLAGLVLDGGGTTSTGATVTGAITPQAKTGAILVFKNASTAAAIPPILVMAPRR